MTACAWAEPCGMPEGHHRHVCGSPESHRPDIDCHPFEAPTPVTATESWVATDASLDLMEELLRKWPEHGRRRMRDAVLAALPRIEAAAALRATEGLVAALEGVIDRIAIDALVAVHRGEQ